MTRTIAELIRHLQPTHAPNVPAEVVETIFRIEERVQFDDDRREAAAQLRQTVSALLGREP